MIKYKIMTKKILVKVWLLKKYLELRSISKLLEEIGWYKSLRIGLPVDKNGSPIPWYSYPAISFISKRVKSDMKIFEYGSGNSTIWWSRHVSKVIACEHDMVWYEYMKNLMPINVGYVFREYVPIGEYSKKISDYVNYFDVVAIDGRDRVECAKNSLKALNEHGIIIWDNSDREKYAEGFSFLHENGFKRIDFAGIGPISAQVTMTSIFYREHNCFGI